MEYCSFVRINFFAIQRRWPSRRDAADDIFLRGPKPSVDSL
jgi:hypothetical protein